MTRIYSNEVTLDKVEETVHLQAGYKRDVTLADLFLSI